MAYGMCLTSRKVNEKNAIFIGYNVDQAMILAYTSTTQVQRNV